MEQQAEISSLETKTRAELTRLLARQEKLVANRSLLNKLPDKGQKLKLLSDKIQQLIAKYDAQVDDTADLLEKMDIGVPQNVSPAATINPFLKTDIQPKKERFKPYRTLHADKIPEGLRKPDLALSKAGANIPRYKDRPPDMSAVSIPPLRHPGTQAIDLKEAAELLQKQRSRVEALQAQQSAERLAERLHIQMGDYKPQNSDRYREHDVEDSSPEDEDDD